MPVTIDTHQYAFKTDNCGTYDYMDLFIEKETGEGSLIFSPCGDRCEEVVVESDEVSPEQWDQLVKLDQEMVSTMNTFINRAAEIMLPQQDR